MTDEELRLAHDWYGQGKPPSQIAELLDRDHSTITRHLVQGKENNKPGPKGDLSDKQVDALYKKYKDMLAKARKSKKPYEVTVSHLKRASRCKASPVVIQRRFREKGIYFRPLRAKPLLTDEDIADRYSFARKYKDKPESFFERHIDLHIDMKKFKVYLNGKSRARAASEGIRGAYRKHGDGDGLKAPYVKGKKDLKWNPGAQGVLVLAGVKANKVVLWHYLDGKTWNAKEASDSYSGPILECLKRSYPTRRSFRILEDNDPVGFKTKLAEKTKREKKLQVFAIPKRSPDFNVLDYAIWEHVNRNMRRQESKWRGNKKESRKAYLERLRRTALRLPPSVVRKSVRSLKRRCQQVYDAEGGHIEG